MAIDIFSIPAISSEPERVFSQARCTIDKQRSRLKASNIEVGVPLLRVLSLGLRAFGTWRNVHSHSEVYTVLTRNGKVKERSVFWSFDHYNLQSHFPDWVYDKSADSLFIWKHIVLAIDEFPNASW